MSRIGKRPIEVPDKVSVSIEDKRRISVKGPKGELQLDLPPDMTVTQENGALLVHRPSDERRHRALHGLTRALIANMVQGVSEGFRRSLIVEGVGYSGELRGKDLVLRLGYSHEIVVTPPENITFSVEGRNPTTIHVDGIDKQVVGQVAANIRE